MPLHPLPEASTETRRQAQAFVEAWQSGQTAFELPTSGSTGAAKTIEVSRTRMEASARATIAALGLAAGKAALVCLNTAYIGGKMALVRGLLLGWDMYLTDPAARALAPWPLAEPPYHASLVPIQLEAALADAALRARLEGMHSALIGGAPLSPALEQAAATVRGAALYQTFGMTETVSHIALHRLNGPEASAFYQLLPGHEARADERGCLAVRGPVTEGRWVQSNDRVELSAGGHLFRWLGRADFTINTGGLKLQPEALEAELSPLLAAYGLHGAFYITARPDERLGSQVVLVIETPNPVDVPALLLYLAARLPRFHAPRTIEIHPTLERTPTGKIKRT